ncbi:tryptophan halogenase [Hirschia baltica ATCC 49814]|uniref:Tryptophan halogenase n=1 Tax=Hirschia baltica (strain ATCC 49814 / DSM 5838 / IFAM 1418) TaxID=582402 RepID=C6XNI9_HIRBI|nr:tryptophan halogenase [Hirschia baltica ATCC 49814]
MVDNRVKSVIIVGGGTAGWMAAAGIAKAIGSTNLQVTLIESEDIGIVGVGEATLPHLRYFIQSLGIDEREFMAATDATVKLGIEFVDWARVGDSYIHPFGDYGLPNDGIPFHQFYHKHQSNGPICDYSLPIVAARKAKFELPSQNASSVNSTYRFAYQFDATKFGPFLREHSERLGVKRVEGRIVNIEHSSDGNISALGTEDGRRFSADFFVDCSGFRGLLIDGALKTKWESWTKWLPCDRAIAAPCEHKGKLLPYTRATAKDAGWQWRIPLQSRAGNGYVYSSQFIANENAEREFLNSLEGAKLADPRVLKFETGKRKKLWSKNCLSIGLSGGFLEPLESTSIYLIQQGITYFLELFPEFKDHSIRATEYNRMMDIEFERIRDFLILHYHATEREDTEFWREMKYLDVPQSLKEKMELFKECGRVKTYANGLFLEPSWVAVYYGQRVIPDNYDSRVDMYPEDEVKTNLMRLKSLIARSADNMMPHEQWLKQFCKIPHSPKESLN